jgi:hypothetical protein
MKMNKVEMIEQMKGNPMKKYTHHLLHSGEYIYMDYFHIIRDRFGHVLENFASQDLKQDGWEAVEIDVYEDSRNKLHAVLSNLTVTSLKDFVTLYMNSYEDNVSTKELMEIIEYLINRHLSPRTSNITLAIKIASEKVKYLSDYMNGRMYTTEDAARENFDIQLDNLAKLWKTLGEIK